jgi:hypothetical protein
VYIVILFIIAIVIIILILIGLHPILLDTALSGLLNAKYIKALKGRYMLE